MPIYPRFKVCLTATTPSTPHLQAELASFTMREIVYIQAGNFSSYIGTHFWNTQDAYLNYGEVPEDSPHAYVDNDISFREGLTSDGTPTYCPRLLLFDSKGADGVTLMSS